MTDKPFISKSLIPSYSNNFDLYKHVAKVLDFILNESLYNFSTIEELNDVLKLYFGEKLTDDQQENVLVYYKLFVEPYLGTLDSIEKIFNILNVDAKVIVWFKNRVPLPPYKFNLEFSHDSNILNLNIIKGILDLVKNERSHLASIKNTGESDIFVWDYSYWDLDCYDNPTGVVIDGILFNLKRYIDKEYNLGFEYDYKKWIARNSNLEQFLFSNEFVNNNLKTNFDDTANDISSFTRIKLTDYGLSVNYDTDLIGSLDNSLLSSQTNQYKASMSKEINLNYLNNIIMHLNAYTSINRDNKNLIFSIKDKTSNYFFNVNDPLNFNIITTSKYKNFPILNLDKTYLLSPKLSSLATQEFSIFLVFNISNISFNISTLISCLDNSFKCEISQSLIRISSLSNTVAYSISLTPSNYTYLVLTSNTIRVGSTSYTHNLNLKFTNGIIIGNSNMSLNFTNLITYNKIISISELNTLINSYVE